MGEVALARERGNNKTDYFNEFAAQPLSTPYYVTPIAFPDMPPIFTARIDASTAQNVLDSSGNTHTKLYLDNRDVPMGEALPTLARTQANLGPSTPKGLASGIHLPPAPNSDVIVTYHESDPDQVFILASVPNTDHASPVNAMSSTQHRWRTPQGQESVFEDRKDAQHIHVKTSDELNRLQMNAKDGAHQINVESLLGEVRFNVEQSLAIVANDWFENTAEQHTTQVQTNYQSTTQQGDIHQQTKQNITHNAKQNIRQQVQKDHHILSGGDMTFDAKQKFTATSTDGNLLIHAQDGHVIIQAVDAINIIGAGNGTISLNNQKSGMQIDKDGKIILYGQNMQTMSDGGIELHGNINYGNPASAPPAPAKPEIKKPDDVEVATVDKNGQVKFNRDELIIQLIDPATQKPINGNEWHDNLEIELRHVELITEGEVSYWQPQDAKLGKWMPEGFWSVLYLDLTKALQISLRYTKLNQVCYCINQDGKVCYPQDTLIIPCDSTKQTSKTDKNNNTIKQRTLKLTILRPDIRFNLRISDEKYYIHKMVFPHLTKHPLHSVITNFREIKSKFITEDKSVSSNDFNSRNTFTAAEIAALKSNGNNVTLFVHGYNVKYGTMGNAFILSRNHEGKAHIKGFTNDETGLYRDPPNQLLEPYTNPHSYHPDDAQVNGTDAQNWFTLMNYNLNKATGQFDGKDYNKYTPVVNIAWAGDPHNPLDYMAAVQMAQCTAPLFTQLVQQLLEANIEVNIIAHSLGNCLLMNTLDDLGASSYANKVNHVFMWQAAIPDSSFATEKSTHPCLAEKYFFPNAYQGAKTFSVLYSNHDNVLGQAPNNETLEQLSKEKSDDPTMDFETRTMEVLINEITRQEPRLPLQSVYHFANLIGEPLSDLWLDDQMEISNGVPDITSPRKTAETKRTEFYQNWCNTFKPINAADSLVKQQALLLQKGYQRELAIMGRFLQVLYEGTVQNHDFAVIRDYVLLKAGLADEPVAKMVQQRVQAGQPIPEVAFVDDSSLDGITPANLQVAVIAVTCLQTPNAQVRPAMGYSGPDKPTIDKLKGKLILVPQHEWLTSHSAMKIPSKDLMEHVYEDKIFKAPGYKLGRYT